ncbi:MAG: JAB domain-containing protein, partial [Leptothrix ochracea]|uniref:JAB domain-containing protein n=1 Tax=Leptothrix ochracea TaxID=735331 RepID=UPI0034E2B80B
MLREETRAAYGTPKKAPSRAAEDRIIARALAILDTRLKAQDGTVFDSPRAVRQYVRLHLSGLEHEVFGVLFLDAQHRLISFEEMFRGTLTQT